MIKLRYGYLAMVIITGLAVIVNFIWTLPDGKLRITFCNVGQGDAAYIRFPDGRDMMVDGGPDETVLDCLGRHMPFWDRTINIAALSHPQNDHLKGLVNIVDRYKIDYFVRSGISSPSEGFIKLSDSIKAHRIPQKYMTAGDEISIGHVQLKFIWPSEYQLSSGKKDQVSGVSADQELNDYSLVFNISYGMFDALFTGDADSHIESIYPYRLLANKQVDVLKFPHHGSKTGVTESFLHRVNPRLAVISVGKNSYGHPAKEVLDILQKFNIRVLRTDTDGDITIVSDGHGWKVEN